MDGCCFPLSISVEIPLEVETAIVSFQFTSRDDAIDKVKTFLLTENIPPYLHNPIYNAVSEGLLESWIAAAKSPIQSSQEAHERVSDWISALERKNSRWSSGKASPAGDDSIYLDFDDREAGTTPFNTVFHTIINHSREACDAVMQMEQNFAKDVQQIHAARATAVETLRAQQAEEADHSATGSTPDATQIAFLAHKHVKEMETLERRWDLDVDAMMHGQLMDYRKFVRDLYARELFGQRSSLLLISPKRKDNEPVADITPARNSYLGWMKSVFSPANAALGEVASATARIKARAGLGSSPSSTPPPAERQSEGFTIHLGSQMKTAFNIRLIAGSISESICHPQIDEMAQRTATAMALYSNSLTATLLLVNSAAEYKTPVNRMFLKTCTNSTDFHFEPVGAQLAHIRQEGLLNPGDVYVTKHSNLAGVHLVFHLVCDSKSLTLADSAIGGVGRSPMISGLRNALATAARFDVTTFSIPLLLIDAAPSDPEAYATSSASKRAEGVLKCVKGALMETATAMNSLSTVQLYLPEPAPFAHYRNLIGSVFRVQ